MLNKYYQPFNDLKYRIEKYGRSAQCTYST